MLVTTTKEVEVYVRKKTVKRGSQKATPYYNDNPESYTYYQLVHGYRDENGKVKQEVLAHLGRYPTVEEAVEGLQSSFDHCTQMAAAHRRAAELIRSGALQGRRLTWGTRGWLVPKPGTKFDPDTDEAPTPGGFAPSGWFYVKAQTTGRGRESGVEAAEREAAEYERKASAYGQRLKRLKAVVTNNSETYAPS